MDVGVAGDALLVAERLQEGLAERDSGVLGRVVLVDMQVARHLDVDVEEAMPREELQHVVEEADAGRDLGLAGAVEWIVTATSVSAVRRLTLAARMGEDLAG